MTVSKTAWSLGACMALVGVGVFGIATPAAANTEPPSEVDQLSATVEGGDELNLASVLDEAAPVSIDLSGENAIDAVVDGVAVGVPNDPSDPLTLSSRESGTLSIELPSASEARNAEVLAQSVVGYDNNDGSVTVPVVRDDGALQILTVLTDSSAPTTFEYRLSLSGGASIAPTADGGFAVLDAAGVESFTAEPAWATDAEGQGVPTHYEIADDVVTQVVDTSRGDVTFPVVADPAISTTTYQYRTVNVVRSPNQVIRSKLVGACKVVRANTTCSIGGSYKSETIIGFTAEVTPAWVAASLNISHTLTTSGTISCTSPKLPAGVTFSAYSMGTRYTYNIEKWKVVKSGGNTIENLVSRSGQLTSYSPIYSIQCG